jgi:hypothetical protein
MISMPADLWFRGDAPRGVATPRKRRADSPSTAARSLNSDERLRALPWQEGCRDVAGGQLVANPDI